MRHLLPAAVAVALIAPEAGAQQVRQMLNGMRAEVGLGPVTPSPRLEEAAMAHALDMAQNGFFAHVGSDGSSAEDRARRAGYSPCTIAETIAQGRSSLTGALGGWAQAEPDRAKMLDPQITDYGLVRAPGDIWVLLLGRDGC